MIKILDCTLRDGGYINGWDFGYNSIQKIYKNLLDSKVDYIEIGFLKEIEYDKDKTLYNNIKLLEDFKHDTKSKICLMIMPKEFDFDKIPDKTNDINLDCIRYVIKKERELNIFEKIEKVRKIKDKGYEIAINITNIDTYSNAEFLNVIKKLNEIQPETICLVDTKGVLREKDLKNYHNIIEDNLDKKTALGFHSHNNLQLSFLNAQFLIQNAKRDLIIDSSVFGMGRGAGNLPSELLIQYLNENNNTNYNAAPILKIIDEQINPIYKKTPWGYSIPYYLSAINNCHPNYAKFLVEKGNVSNETMDKLLSMIPNDKKTFYNKDIIKQIYFEQIN